MEILIIAGPNGAGKTTFAREYLPHEAGVQLFVNADLIAAGLSPFAPEGAAITAGRYMLARLDELARRGESFAFETTLAGHNYLKRIRAWQAAGYHVTMYFLSLPNPEMAIARVAERVRRGGHSVPEDVVRRRYKAGLDNFRDVYQTQVDAWLHYDNSGPAPVMIERGTNQ
jgi:predicted ABC-type ATPase